MKRKLLIISLIIIFIILGILASNNYTRIFDDFIYSIFISIKNQSLTKSLKILTSLANYKSIIFYNIGIFIYILITRKSKLLLVPINSILSIIFNNIFKLIFRRNRPLLIALITENGYSYPSGHAMISILFFGTISYIVSKSNMRFKNIIRFSIGIFIIIIGISRIYLGVHYASDIIGGYLLGMIILLIGIDIKKEHKNESINNGS